MTPIEQEIRYKPEKSVNPDTTHEEFQPLIARIRELSPDEYYVPVFRHPMDFYRQRIRMSGAGGLGKILDAGHGFGQWTVALAEVNDQVTGIDHNAPRCEISELVRAHYEIGNCRIQCDSLDNLDTLFEPGEFDAIWCWSVIMFVDRATVMKAFNKLLKPGGLLFLGAVNTPYRWLYKYYLGKKRGITAPNYYKTCVRGIRGSHAETGVNAFGFRSARRIAERYGFSLQAIGYDGEIDVTGTDALHFETTPLKIFQNIEMILRKELDLS